MRAGETKTLILYIFSCGDKNVTAAAAGWKKRETESLSREDPAVVAGEKESKEGHERMALIDF